MFNSRKYDPAKKGNARYVRDLSAVGLTVLLALFALNAQGSTANPSDPIATASPEKVATSRGEAANALSHTGMTPKPGALRVKPRNAAPASNLAKSTIFGDFEIFDAAVTLYFDDDFDGHYYGIDVNFDADTEYAAADVYARLYLSLEGGPWEEYFVTEVFTIFGDSGSDDYTVETELYSGYPTAYYDVLIELYDYDTGDLVAEFGPADSAQMDEAPLEDQQKDIGVVVVGPEPIISQSRGGGGSLSFAALMLALLTLLARRARVGGRRPITVAASTQD